MKTVIVADTSAIVALLDADETHHRALAAAFEAEGERWILPWAILPEVDYLATKYLGAAVAQAFQYDVAQGIFRIERYDPADMKRALALQKKYRALELGLVDSIVMAIAERHRASAIATLDERHFRAMALNIKPTPRLIPADA